MNTLKNFFKRRTLVEKLFIGISSTILILGIYSISTYEIFPTEKEITQDSISTENEISNEPSINEEISESKVLVEPEEKKIILPEYTVAKIDNSNFGSCIRETLHIVVSNSYTNDQLLQIAEKEIKNYTSTKKVNALTIGFYESKDKIGKGYEMGSVEYVPFGDFSKAHEVTTGDYTDFQIVNNIKDKLVLNTKKEEPIPIKSNLNKIKADFEAVYSNSKVTSISNNSGTLKIVIKEPVHELGLPIDETTLSTYIENSLDNIGSDITTINITVSSPESSANAILDMSNLINDDLGKYFESDYIMDNMKLNQMS